MFYFCETNFVKDKVLDRKKIPDFERYEIDRYGSVFSMIKTPETLLKLKRTRKCYLTVRIMSNNGTKKTLSVHRLVAKLFIENPENKPQVNHVDGNKQNNHVSNLEWCTARENVRHAYASGLVKVGIENIKNRFSDFDIKTMKEMFDSGRSVRSIGKHFGVGHKHISMILKGEIYTNSSIKKTKNLVKPKFTYNETMVMKSMRKDGCSYRKIAEKFNSTHSTIKRYIDGAK